MSKNIDERVVQMKFDNKDFEANTKTTMSTIDKLKQGLNFTGATKGLEGISAAAKNVNLSGISTAVESVQLKFTALQVAATTVIANITNSALEAGKRIVSALTIDPVKTGFSEYELKMGSIQTIMAGTGESLEAVNGYLEELNKYSDQTIYSFADMTQNIGKFTNAGVSLKDSVASIQGISNAAALSGANANEASRAMYNFAQALSSGSVKLIDWKSIELANMGTKSFKEELLKTAVSLGTVSKAADGMYKTLSGDSFSATKDFNTYLEKQWMTTEVLVQTLGRYSDATTDIGKKSFAAAQDIKTLTQFIGVLKESAQSGWAQTWELIVGDFEESKKLFTMLNNIFGSIISSSANARNAMLSGALNSKKFIDATDWEKIAKANGGVRDFQNLVKDTAREHGIAIDQMVLDEGSFAKSLTKGWFTLDILKDTLKKSNKDVTKETKDIAGKIKEFEKLAKEVVQGNWGNGDKRKTALKEAGHDYQKIQDIVNKMVNGTIVDLDKLSESELKTIGLTDKEVATLKNLNEMAKATGTPLNKLMDDMNRKPGGELLSTAFERSLTSLKKVLDAIGNAWNDIFPTQKAADRLYNVIVGIEKFSQTLTVTKKDTENITATFKGLFAVLDIVTSLMGGGLKIAITTIAKILGFVDVDILSVTASAGKAIVSFRDWLFETNAVTKGFNKFTDGIAVNVKIFREWLNTFLELKEVQDIMSTFGNTVDDTFYDLQLYFGGGIEVVKSFITRVKSMDKLSLKNIRDMFIDFGKNVLGYFSNIDGKFPSLEKVIKSFKDSVLKYLSETVDGFDEAKEKVKDFISMIKDKFGKINFGEIIALIGGAVMIKFLWDLGGAITNIVGIFGGIMLGIGDFKRKIMDLLDLAGKYIKAKTFEKNAKAIQRLAISIGIMAASLWLVAQIPQDKLLGASTAILGLAAGLGAIAFGMSKLTAVGGIKGAALAIVAIGAAGLMMAESLKIITELNQKDIGLGLLTLTTISGGLVALAIILAKYAPVLSTGSLTLLAIGGAVKLMASALDDLSQIHVTDMTETLTLLGASIVALAGVSLAAGGLTIGSALTVVGIAAALIIVAKAFDAIKDLDMSAIKKNMEAFIAVFGTISALLIASHFAGANAAKAGVMILMISASLLMIVGVFKLIANMDPAVFDKALVGVIKMMAVMAAVIAASNFAGPNAVKAGVMLMAMSASLLILAFVLGILSMLDPDGLKRATIAVSVLEAFFIGLIAVTELVNTSKKGVITLIALISAVVVMFAGLAVLAGLDQKGLMTATVAMSMLMGMFTILLAVSSVAGEAIPMVLIMGLVVAEIAAILYVLSKFSDTEKVLSIAESLSILLLSLSASIAILALAGLGGPAALIGIASLEVLILSFGGLIMGLGALATYFPDLELLLNKGIPLLEKIGYALGSFFGNIVNGFATSATAGLPQLGNVLSDFMTNAKPFFDGVQGIDESAAKGAKAIAETILILTAANLLDKITSFIAGGSSIASFGKELVQFGSYFKQYASYLSGIDSSVVEASSAAAKSLAEFASAIPNSGGYVSLFTGDNPLWKFGVALALFGPEFAVYAKSISGIDSNAVTNSASAAKSLAEFAGAIPNTGGIVSWFTGDNPLHKFGAALALFGPEFAIYAESVRGVGYSVVTNSVNAATALAELASILPNSGGLVSLFTGDNTMDKMGVELVAFGLALKGYAAAVSGLDIEAIKSSALGARALMTVANMIPNSGGLGSAFEGDNNISSFGFYLKSFGEYLKAYSNDMSEVDIVAISATTSQVERLITMAQSMMLLDPAAITGFGVSMNQLGLDGLNGFIKAFSDSSAVITSTVQLFITRFTFAITINKYKFLVACVSMVTEGVNLIRGKYPAFFEAGMFMVEGFARGISANTFRAQAQAKAMAEAALDAARKALDEHSPSKKSYQIGDYMGIGFVNALGDHVITAYRAGTNMAKSAISGLSETISKISDVINGDIETQPTIRPVLDLSEVEAGTGVISNLLNRRQALTVNAGMVRTAAEIQNGVNSVSDRTTPTTLQFIQNNNSPKALSRIEIYRQTRNLISSTKEVLA